ncbi:HAD-IA family hydrolase [Streptacidiphilus sp. EB103A]|uniref:HAD-IA family hydrolase n=1 Tax=Streptacidiphilus sp. EB103A TaxID=3156275 RepID=UPI003513DE2F
MIRRGLILDFGGVLTSAVPDCAYAFDARSGLAPGSFLAVISQNPQGAALYADLERGAISQAEWNRQTGELLGIDGTDLLERVLEDLHPEPGMISAAMAAKAAGIRVGIFSNSLGREPFDIYQGYGLDQYGPVLVSEDYRMRKPDAKLYPIMLDLMELPADQCVFVDDTKRNLVPAEQLGIATVLAGGNPRSTIAEVESLLGIPLATRVDP